MQRKSGLWVIVVAALAYLIAVTQRSTMGAASVLATERFSVNAEQLSALAVFQIIVYAAMQIPVGLLLDRFGPRILLTIGALVMSTGQIFVAFSTNLSAAVVGRMLVGLGDAFTFISMIRLVNGWYSGKRASQLQQWLGNLGQIGQVLSAFPFAYFLHLAGWTSAFIGMAAVGLFITVLTWFATQDDRSSQDETAVPLNLKKAISVLIEQVKLPSTRMAFWTHFSTQSAGTTLLLLWGMPFLMKAEQLDLPVASSLLSSFVVFGILAGFAYAHICAHRPELRRAVVTVMVTSVVGAFLALMLWPGQTPLWILAAWAFIVGSSGPASMIAFDYSKEYVPKTKLGATNGFINIGGFLATFTQMFAVGLILDLYFLAGSPFGGGGKLYSVEGFKVAFIAIILICIFGLWRFRVTEHQNTQMRKSRTK